MILDVGVRLNCAGWFGKRYLSGSVPAYQALLDEAFGYMQRVNPALRQDDILAAHVARLRYAQPICEPGFASMIPPVQTPIRGLQIADTCFYYPEDRGIAESVRLGREMAKRLNAL
jgi:protoporphyrinogen oxidase